MTGALLLGLVCSVLAAPAAAVGARASTVPVSGVLRTPGSSPTEITVALTDLATPEGVGGFTAVASVSDTGRFEVTGVRPGRYSVLLFGGQWAPQCYGEVLAELRRDSRDDCARVGTTVTVGTEPVQLATQTMRFRRPVFTGTITGPDGRPLPGARIHYEGDDSAVADAAGRYRVAPARLRPESESPSYTLDGPLGDHRYQHEPIVFTPYRVNTITRRDLRVRTRTSLTVHLRRRAGTVRLVVDADPGVRGSDLRGTVRVTYRTTKGRSRTMVVRTTRRGHASASLRRIRPGLRTVRVVYPGTGTAGPATKAVHARVARR